MANTTNFGWETPDDTDLVKDGAAAMRTLGNAIDASLVDLKGGTTGQVLAKNSNTDLDYIWTTIAGGGWTEIVSGNLPTNANTFTISSIPTTYKYLRLYVRDFHFGASNNGNVRIRLNADNSSIYQAIGGLTGWSTAANDASINCTNTYLNNADNFIIMDLLNYADTTVNKQWFYQSFSKDSDTTWFGKFQFGSYRSNTAITSLQIYDNSSNNFAAGNYILYGGN